MNTKNASDLRPTGDDAQDSPLKTGPGQQLHQLCSDHRELLRLAAKAAGKYASKKDCPNGWEGIRPDTWGCFTMGGEGGTPDYQWNPLKDDDDALRLAVKLRLNIYRSAVGKFVSANNEQTDCTEYLADHSTEEAAVRRAIVRAAATIGKAMP